jgi:tetratricopeptide (TPR) repeat protein
MRLGRSSVAPPSRRVPLGPFHPTTCALVALSAALVPCQEPAAEVAHLRLDPDRGLDEPLRARLRLVDPNLDTWDVERRAALVDARLRELESAWSAEHVDERLAELGWKTLVPVPPLVPDELEPVFERGAWRVLRARPSSTALDDVAFGAALVDWRSHFGPGARLECEVFDIEPIAGGTRARVRLVASGPVDGGRLQHNAEWACRWRDASSALELAEVRVDAFESALHRGSGAGQFEDATQAAFGGETCFAEQLAVGLDDWRARLASTLEPGSLGHHGLALGDVDGDGLEDLYLCQPGGLPNRLLLRRSDGTVRDASLGSGVDFLDYTSSALLADFDQDLDSDLVVATATALDFLSNEGGGRFEERARIERSLATSLAAADFDGDGDLDLFACSYLSPFEKDGLPVPYYDAENGEQNALYRNDGGFCFQDVAAEVGLEENGARFSFAAAWEDFDADGDQDLYVANDFGRNNLYRNEGGRFRDVARELGCEDISAGMGVSWGDADGDGWMDLYVTNMYTSAACRLTARPGFRPHDRASERAFRDHAMGNSLLLNRGGQRFEDAAEASGTGRGRWGWGGLFVDLDNDGGPDLVSPNGFVSSESARDLDSYFWRQVVLQSPANASGSSADYALGWRAINRLVRQGWSWNGHERDVAFLNLGDGSFADVSSAAGLDLPDDTRAAARIDWDADGDLDLLVTSRTAPRVRLLLNQAAGPNRWIAFRLRDSSASRTTIGARVAVETTGGRKLIQTVRCGEGFLAQSTSDLHFGLGAEEVASVEVRWPGGEAEPFGAPPSGRAWLLERGAERASELTRPALAVQLAVGPPSLPLSTGSSRTVVPVALPLPSLPLETFRGQSASLLGITIQGPRGTGSPMLLVLWSSSEATCLPVLRSLAASADALRSANLEVLALSVEQGDDRERARAALRELDWPFAAACATPEAIQILELTVGALHDSALSLPVPSSFLVDPKGQLSAVYLGRVDSAVVVADTRLAQLDPTARLHASVPFSGRWIAPPRADLANRVAARLAEHGLERAAAEYGLLEVETRELTALDFKLELAQALYDEGRVDESINYFRAVLAIDPSHFLAARGLARALHQRGALPEALEAYRRAVALEPTDALTRCNLGLLFLALSDLESAQRELATLRPLDAALAETLSQKIELYQSMR